MTSGGDEQVEQPILQLGAVGFSLPRRAAITQALASLPAAWTPWHLGGLAGADAWWVDGRATQVLADGHLMVAAGHPQEAGLNLKLTSIDRPIGFAAPLVAAGFEPRCVFELDDLAGMHSALHLFGTWLQPLHCLYAAGALVMRKGAALRHTLHHLHHKGTLIGVLDYRSGQVGLLATAKPADIWSADWVRRPAGAHELPANFIRYTPAQLLWTYVRRTDRELLPERYRSDTIYFRRTPRLPADWLREPSLAVLSELHAQPGNFRQLAQRTGLGDAALALELSCLYYAGAVTTTPARAATAEPGAAARGGESSFLASTQLRPGEPPPAAVARMRGKTPGAE